MNLWFRYRLLYPVIARLPRRLSYKLATLKGYIDGFFGRESIRQTAKGICTVFPETPPQRARDWALAQRRMLSREILDVYWLNRLNKKNIDQFIRLEGVELLKSARKSGRGVILYSSHYSRLIMPGMAIGVQGIETSCLTADITSSAIPAQEQAYLTWKTGEMLRQMGGDAVQKNESLRKLYKIIQDGKILYMTVDAPAGDGDSVKLFPFLGGQGRFAGGIVRLARKTDALLVPYFACEEGGGLVGRFLQPIDIRGLDESAALQRIFAPVQAAIRERPDQWWLWSALPAVWQPKP